MYIQGYLCHQVLTSSCQKHWSLGLGKSQTFLPKQERGGTEAMT